MQLLDKNILTACLTLISFFTKYLESLSATFPLPLYQIAFLNNLGCCHRGLKDLKTSLFCFDSALKLVYTNQETQPLFPICYLNLASIFHSQKSFQRAKELTQQALLYAQQNLLINKNLKGILLETVCLYNKAIEEEKIGEKDLAKQDFLLALKKIEGKVDKNDPLYIRVQEAVYSGRGNEEIGGQKHFLSKGFSHQKKRLIVTASSRDMIDTAASDGRKGEALMKSMGEYMQERKESIKTIHNRRSFNLKIDKNEDFNDKYMDYNEIKERQSISFLESKGILKWKEKSEEDEEDGEGKSRMELIENLKKTIEKKDEEKEMEIQKKVLSLLKNEEFSSYKKKKTGEYYKRHDSHDKSLIFNDKIEKKHHEKAPYGPFFTETSINKEFPSKKRLFQTTKSYLKPKSSLNFKKVKDYFPFKDQEVQTFSKNLVKIPFKTRPIPNDPLFLSDSQTKKLIKLQKFVKKHYKQLSKPVKLNQKEIKYMTPLILSIQRSFRKHQAKLHCEYLQAKKNKTNILIARIHHKTSCFFIIDVILKKKDYQLLFFKREFLCKSNITSIIEEIPKEKLTEPLSRLKPYAIYRLNQLFCYQIISLQDPYYLNETNESEDTLPTEETQENLLQFSHRPSLARKTLSISERIRLLRTLQIKYLNTLERETMEIRRSQTIIKLFQCYLRTPLSNFLQIIIYSKNPTGSYSPERKPLSHLLSERCFLHGFLLKKNSLKKKRLNTLFLDHRTLEAFQQEINKGNIWDIITINEEKPELSFTEEVLYLTEKLVKPSLGLSAKEECLKASNMSSAVLKLQSAVRELIIRKNKEKHIKNSNIKEEKLELYRFHRPLNGELFLFRIFLLNQSVFFSKEFTPYFLSVCLYSSKNRSSPPVSLVKQSINEKLELSQLKIVVRGLERSIGIQKDRLRGGVHISCENIDLLLAKYKNRLNLYRECDSIMVDVKTPEFSAFEPFENKELLLFNKTLFLNYLNNNNLIPNKDPPSNQTFILKSISVWKRGNLAQKVIANAWRAYHLKETLKVFVEMTISRKNNPGIPISASNKLEEYLSNENSIEKLMSNINKINMNGSPELRFNSDGTAKPGIRIENQPFYRKIRIYNEKAFEISLYYNETYKAIIVEAKRKNSSKEPIQTILIPVSAFGHFELLSIEDFQRNSMKVLLENLVLRDNTLYFNYNKELGLNIQDKQRKKSVLLKEKNINSAKPKLLSIIDMKLQSLPSKISYDIIKEATPAQKAFKIKKSVYCGYLNKGFIDITVFIKEKDVIFSFYDNRNKTYIEKNMDLTAKFETLPRFYHLFLCKNLQNLLEKVVFNEKDLFNTHNSFESIKNQIPLLFKKLFSKEYQLFSAIVLLQNHFRRLKAFKTVQIASKTLKDSFYRKIINKNDYFLIILIYKPRPKPFILIKHRNLSNPRKIPLVYWGFEPKQDKNQLKSYFNELLFENPLENNHQLIIKPRNDSITLITLNPGENPFKKARKLIENPKETPCINKEKAFVSNKIKALYRVLAFFKRIKQRKAFKEDKTLKNIMKKTFLKTFVLKHMNSFIFLHLFFKKPAVFLLTFVNISAKGQNTSKYILETANYSKEMHSNLLQKVVTQTNKMQFNRKMQVFYKEILKSLVLELVFENVSAKLIHNTLNLKEVVDFNNIILKGSIFSQKFLFLTKSLVIIQRRFRRLKLHEKQAFLLESHKNKRDFLLFRAIIQRKGIYYWLSVYSKEEEESLFYKFYARSIEKPINRLFTRYLKFNDSMINTHGRPFLSFLVESVIIDDKKGLCIDYKPKYDELEAKRTMIIDLGGDNFPSEIEMDLQRKSAPKETTLYVPIYDKEIVEKPFSIKGFSSFFTENPKLLFQADKANLRFEVHYKEGRTSKASLLNEGDENSLQINLDLQNFMKYNRGIDFNNPLALQKLANELSEALIINEKGTVMIDSNKISPNCLEIIQKPEENPFVKVNIKKKPFKRKEILLKTIKSFGKIKFLLTASLLEKPLSKIPLSIQSDEEILEEFDVHFEIKAFCQLNRQAPLKISLSLGEIIVLTKLYPVNGDYKQMIERLIKGLKVSLEYFIYEIPFEIDKNQFKKLKNITSDNKNRIIFITTKTLMHIYERKQRVLVKKAFKEYQALLNSFLRVFTKKAFVLEGEKVLFMTLAMPEKGKLGVWLWKAGWGFLKEIGLNYEKYKGFLINPVKWVSFLNKFGEKIHLQGKEVIFQEDKFFEELGRRKTLLKETKSNI